MGLSGHPAFGMEIVFQKRISCQSFQGGGKQINSVVTYDTVRLYVIDGTKEMIVSRDRFTFV